MAAVFSLTKCLSGQMGSIVLIHMHCSVRYFPFHGKEAAAIFHCPLIRMKQQQLQQHHNFCFMVLGLFHSCLFNCFCKKYSSHCSLMSLCIFFYSMLMELFGVDSKPVKYKFCASGGRSCLSSHHFTHLWTATGSKTFIMLTCPCNEHPFTPHVYIVTLGLTGVYIIFLFLL